MSPISVLAKKIPTILKENHKIQHYIEINFKTKF